MEETTRLFAALRPPPEIRARIAEIQAALARELPLELRWTRKDQLHITLFFAPAFPSSKIDALREAIAKLCTGRPPTRIELGPPEVRPARGLPRVLWLPALTGVETLTEIHALLAAAGRRFDPVPSGPASPRFRPHLTLARFPRKTPPHARGSMHPSPALDPPATWNATELELVSSRIERTGARHTLLGTFPLADSLR